MQISLRISALSQYVNELFKDVLFGVASLLLKIPSWKTFEKHCTSQNDQASLLFSLFTRFPFQRSYLWRISESNRWPPACKAGALASWANPPFFSRQLSVNSYQLIDDYTPTWDTQLLKFPLVHHSFTRRCTIFQPIWTSPQHPFTRCPDIVVPGRLTSSALSTGFSSALGLHCSPRQTRTADLYIISVAL